MPELLYIHPRGQPSDLVVPAGALSCMNAARAEKLGRYAFEVTDAEIRGARVIALDLHWAFAFAGFEALVRKIRCVNGNATLVVGGITAGHYARELLARYPIDFVIRGDSEVAFAELVHGVLAGKLPSAIANVWRRDGPAPPVRRLSQAEFDRTDCITADWFPSYLERSRWDSAGFSLGRTLPVARGCPMRCPTCYGSFAETFGAGWLWRSTDSVVDQVSRAAREGTEHFRMVVAKPSQRRLRELLSAVARAGPFPFKSVVGMFSCTAPAPEMAELLADAFPGGIVVSTTHPRDQVPTREATELSEDWARWLAFARATDRTKQNGFEVWALRDETVDCARRELSDCTARTRVTHASAWEVTRPIDDCAPGDMERVRQAVLSHWTFVVARLLSPALARVIAPYAWLDDVERDPVRRDVPEGLESARDLAAQRWRSDRLPCFPDLSVWCAPMEEDPRSRIRGRALGSAAYGDCFFSWFDPLTVVPSFVKLEAEQCHDAVRLRALVPPASSLVFVPCVHGDSPPSRDWLSSMVADGLFAIRLPPGQIARVQVELSMKLNTLHACASDNGRVVASGRSDPGFYQARRD